MELRDPLPCMCIVPQSLAQVAPEIGEAWQDFAARVQNHSSEMTRASRSVAYPRVPGVEGDQARQALMVVSATAPIVNFARASRDAADVLGGLLQELEATRGGLLAAMLSSFALGAALGCELYAWV